MFKKIFLAIIFINFSVSWHPTGHFLTALIAENELKRMGKTGLLKKLDALLDVLKPRTKEKNHAFVECACFPDDIKYLGWTSFNKWHFYDDYIVDKGFSKELASKLHRAKHNILSAINEAKEALKNTRMSLVDDHLSKSFELRYLIHLIGDIHQPLHSTSFVSKDFPKGDVGGNAFPIDHPAKNLHTLWDKCLTTKEFKDTRAPLNDKAWEYLQKKAEYLVDKYPRADLKERLDIKQARDWIKESRKIAQNHVYKGLIKGIKITDDYISKNVPIVEEQIAIGGYRLADLLADIFQDESVLNKHVKNSDDGSDDEEVADDAVPVDDREDSSSGSDNENDSEAKPKHAVDAPAVTKPAAAKADIAKPTAKKEPANDTSSDEEKNVHKKKSPAKKNNPKTSTPAVIKIDANKAKKQPAKEFLDSPVSPAPVAKKGKNLDNGKKPAAPRRRRRMLDDYDPESELDDSEFYLQEENEEHAARKVIREVENPGIVKRFFNAFYGLIFG